MNSLLLLVLLSAPPVLRVPCTVISVHDGDTATVKVEFTVNVRLLDCWAPELNTINGVQAKEALKTQIEGKKGILEVNLEENLSKMFTFGRILAKISVNEQDSSEFMVKNGFATTSKVEKK